MVSENGHRTRLERERVEELDELAEGVAAAPRVRENPANLARRVHEEDEQGGYL